MIMWDGKCSTKIALKGLQRFRIRIFPSVAPAFGEDRRTDFQSVVDDVLKKARDAAGKPRRREPKCRLSEMAAHCSPNF